MSDRAFSQSGAAVPHPLSVRALLGGAARLGFVWLAFGLVIGAALGEEGGIIGLLAYATAGALVTPWLGVVLGLLGGQVQETMVGGTGGALIGTTLALTGEGVPVAFGLGVGLIVGGMVGANYSALCFWRKRLQTVARR